MPNQFDQFDGAPSANPFDQFDRAAPAAAAASPVGVGGRILQGSRDPFDAAAQMLSHALPDSVVNGVNAATGYVNNLPVIGPATKALGMTPATPQQMDQNISANETNYQARRAAAGDTGIDWWRALGNVVGTAPVAPFMPVASSIPGAIATGAATGGVMGSLQPITQGNDFWGQKGEQVKSGAQTGAVLSPMMTWFGKAINPAVSGNVKTLMDAGVTPTPGQILGGAWKRAEDAGTSTPVLGDMIRNAQRRAVEDFNRAAYNDVLAPIGETFSGTVGRQGIATIGNKLDVAYKSLLPNLQFRADPQFTQEVANLSNLASGLPDREAGQFSGFINDKLQKALSPTGNMDGQTFKELESGITKEVTRFSGASDAYQQKLGDAYATLRQSLRDGLQRSNQGVVVQTPSGSVDAAQRLSDINLGWAKLARLELAGAKATAETGTEGIMFTPGQMSQAVRQADTTVRDRATARGTALMQDLSDAGKSVLSSKVPDSGTPFRHAVQLGVGALAGHSLLPEGAAEAMVPAALGIGALSLPYTQLGQRAAAAILAQRPTAITAPLASAVRKSVVPMQAGLLSMLGQ